MELSPNTKRFLLLLSGFTVALVLFVRHITTIFSFLAGVLNTLSPFIVGACLAFILSVPMHQFDKLLSTPTKKGKVLLSSGARRLVSLVLAILLVVLLLMLFSIIVLPELINTVSSLASSVMNFVPIAQGWLSDTLTLLEEYPEIHAAIAPAIPDLNQVASSAIAFVQKYAGTAATTVVFSVSSIFGSVTDVIVSFVFAVYVLLQKESLSRQCKKLLYAFLPKGFCDETLSIAHLTHKTFFSYVTIQCTEALILGVLCFLGMLLFRFPYALVVSVIMIFCALIPIYGAIFSCIVGAFLVLMENPMQALGFVVFILVLQQLETNLIYPRVVSTSINLPPMWVLLSVTVGGGLFGIPGMLTAVPITSICYTLLGQRTHRQLKARGLTPDHFYNPDNPK